MVSKNYENISEISKKLALNKGEGYSVESIRKVLSPKSNKRNSEIELIESLLKLSEQKTKEAIVDYFEELKKDKLLTVRVISKTTIK